MSSKRRLIAACDAVMGIGRGDVSAGCLTEGDDIGGRGRLVRVRNMLIGAYCSCLHGGVSDAMARTYGRGLLTQRGRGVDRRIGLKISFLDIHASREMIGGWALRFTGTCCV